MKNIYFKLSLTIFFATLLYQTLSATPVDSINNSKNNRVPLIKSKTFAPCDDINWATWSSFNGNSSLGTISDGTNTVNVTMTANYSFASTPGIYNHAKFNAYPSPIPDRTVPQTTWAQGEGGTTKMCFSKTVSNPVLLIASLGNSAGLRATLKFSLPYVVLFDGGKMTFDNSTTLTGVEGFAIIMFPGDFDCVTINSTTPEYYTNITWGLKPSPFAVSVIENSSSCSEVKLTASGGVEYLWNGGDTPNSATNTFRSSGTYIVTAKDANGCKTSVSKKVDILPINININGETSACGAVSLTAEGGTSYLWDGGDTPNNATNTFRASGKYTVVVSNQAGCSSALSKDVIVFQSTTTNNTITTPETVLCNGAKTILISGTIPQGATNTSLSYKWQHSDDEQIWADINGETNQELSVQVTKTIYFRRVTFSNNCSSVSNTLKIDFQPLVTASFAGNNINLCKLNTATLNGNTTALNETGTWSVISPAYYAPFNSTNVNNPLAEITNLPPDIDVILKWTISQNTCLTTSSSTVTVHSYSAPVITMPSTLTINQGQSIQIPASVTPLSAGYTYRWIPGIGLDNPNILSPLASPDQTTIYRLTITYGNNCVVEKDIRIAVDKTTKISVCAGSLAQLSGDPILDQNPAIQWQVLSSGTWLNIQNANQANFSLKTDEQFSNQIETVLYRRAITAGNVTYIDSKYEVNTYPLTQNNVINTSTSNFCSNVVSSIAVNGTLPVGASNFPSTYIWERSSDGLNWSTINGETAKDIMISGLIQTTYFRRLTFTNGCPAISNILKITVNPLPTVANAGEDIALCGNSSLALTANPPGNNETGVWSVISTANYNPFNASNVNNPNAVIDHMPSNQKLILQWEIFNQNCGTSTKDEVEIISYRNILLQAPAELTVDFGKKINLGIVSDLTSDDGYTFEWLPKTGLDNPFTLSPDASPLENTVYTLKVNYGQTCEKTVNVLVKVLNNIKIPTSFSPNGDGVNDHWEIKNIANYPGSRVSVYNRYGTAIYKSTNYTAPWDGTHNGKVLPVGTYYYVILLKDKKNSVFNGSITIIQ